MEAKVDRNLNLYDGKAYALTSNIMLTAIVILFFTVILIICLHLYCHCYLRRARHRPRPRQGFRVFSVHPITSDVPPRGLDPSVIQSLPVFLYSSDTHPRSDPVECTICLSPFEENESGRVLPKCNHTFHVECIDMWFQFHSTCPLCRSLVEPTPPGDQPGPEVVIDVCEPARPEAVSSSECQQHDGEEENRIGPTLCSSSSSIGFRRKPSFVGVTIEVPLSRSFGRQVEESKSSFRSPMSRILSFKRILSRERKACPSSPPSDGAGGCSSTTELETSQ